LPKCGYGGTIQIQKQWDIQTSGKHSRRSGEDKSQGPLFGRCYQRAEQRGDEIG
jgi:hypothetical protein